jgi:hypothetical protein
VVNIVECLGSNALPRKGQDGPYDAHVIALVAGGDCVTGALVPGGGVAGVLDAGREVCCYAAEGSAGSRSQSESTSTNFLKISRQWRAGDVDSGGERRGAAEEKDP